MTASAVFTPLPESEIDAALSGAAAELHDIAQVQSKNLRLLQAVMRANLKGGLKNLLWLLCMHYNDTKDCAWPSIERLAKLSLTEARTVQRNIQQLVKAGLVQVGRVPGIRSNAFSIVEEAIQAIAIDGISFAKNQLAAATSKGDICAPMGDISSAKGDIFSAKGDTGVTLTEGTDGTEKKNGGGTDARAPAPVPAPAPATPAVPAPPPPPPAFFASHEIQNSQTAVDSETADAPATPAECSVFAGLVDSINAQRAVNGKKPFVLADLAQLRAEAAKAGISAVQAAEWVLERPSRNFFRAEYFVPATPAAAPAAPTAPANPLPAPTPPAAPLTPQEQAVQDELVAQARAKAIAIVESMRVNKPIVGNVFAQQPVYASTGHIDTDNLRGPKFAVDIVQKYMRGEPVNLRPLELACEALRIDRKALRAQRAAQQAATA